MKLKIPARMGRLRMSKGKTLIIRSRCPKGGTNEPSNLRSVSPSENRSFSRNADHTVKRNVPKKKVTPAKKKKAKKKI
jgi:hypothetical protein